MTLRLLQLAACLGCLCQLVMAEDMWEMPPFKYSEQESKDPIAQLAKNPSSIPDTDPLGRLRFVLKTLDIPEESQVLVFSKTSKQNDFISPISPRSVFFNENHYVGYVPGGHIEVISHDKKLGPVFYLITNNPGLKQPKITRESGECFSCHGTARTENVPGVLVRSVYPDEGGFPMLEHGSFLIDHTSPIPERWGGYYVTGKSSLPHLGNRVFDEELDPMEPGSPPRYLNLSDVIDTRRYLQPTSDIVALMVLEHQTAVLNRMQAASLQYQRFIWLRQTLNSEARVDDATSREHLQHAAKPIVDLLFYKDEAPLGPDGIEGSLTFQKAFTKRYPKCKDGRSLADFQLYSRLFKYPCSHMVYSEAFTHLPKPLREEVIRQMHEALTTDPAQENHPQLSASSRKKIQRILEDTLDGWPKG